jgi:hypothetical protein
MTPRPLRVLALAAATSTAAGALYTGLVGGAVTLDLGVGRRTRPLGPLRIEVSAPRDVVYAVTTAPYAERRTRALEEKVEILERTGDMVLAAHRTPVRGGLTAVTLETVTFAPPERVGFRLVRGPVPHVSETFTFERAAPDRTVLTYEGEMGTDLWGIGERWGEVVARAWNHAVAQTFEEIRTEAERRHAL